MLHRTDGLRIVASASCQYSDCSGIPFFRSDNINLNAEGAITVFYLRRLAFARRIGQHDCQINFPVGQT
jgi:hypothetical protein